MKEKSETNEMRMPADGTEFSIVISPLDSVAPFHRFTVQRTVLEPKPFAYFRQADRFSWPFAYSVGTPIVATG